MTNAKRRRNARSAKMRAGGQGSWSGMVRAWEDLEPFAPPENPQESLGGQGCQPWKGYFEEILTEENYEPCAGGTALQESYSSPIRKGNTPDIPDQAQKSAVSSGAQTPDRPLTKTDLSLTSDVARAVLAYQGYWPLKLSTICRAMSAAQHPLITTPVREFIALLDGVTPEFEGAVRWAARRAIQVGIIPPKSVDLRGEPHEDLF